MSSHDLHLREFTGQTEAAERIRRNHDGRRRRVLAGLGAVLLGATTIGVGGASAAVKPSSKTKTKSAPTATVPSNPCPASTNTTVAALINTKYANVSKVYETADDTKQPRNYLAVGIDLAGDIVYTVNKTEGDWLNVNVPSRPNGAVGWIKKNEVSTFQHPYLIKIELGIRRLTVCNAGRIIQQEKIGVGKSERPTPTGNFYTADLLRPKGGPNGAYGPFAFGLSGFSDTVFDFAGGDGRLGIHGTNHPELLGTPASNGCIRVSNAGITKMAKTLPLGVPVQITA